MLVRVVEVGVFFIVQVRELLVIVAVLLCPCVFFSLLVVLRISGTFFGVKFKLFHMFLKAKFVPEDGRCRTSGQQAAGIRIAHRLKKEMKRIMLLPLAAFLMACGANDNKNDNGNYPTYDTTQAPMHINDSTSGRNMQNQGDLRHNIDSDGDENRQ